MSIHQNLPNRRANFPQPKLDTHETTTIPINLAKNPYMGPHSLPNGCQAGPAKSHPTSVYCPIPHKLSVNQGWRRFLPSAGARKWSFGFIGIAES